MTKLYLAALSEQDQDRFIDGWTAASGYVGDMDLPNPWCCPWFYADAIDVEGETPEEWGADYWEQCREEINSLHPEE